MMVRSTGTPQLNVNGFGARVMGVADADWQKAGTLTVVVPEEVPSVTETIAVVWPVVTASDCCRVIETVLPVTATDTPPWLLLAANGAVPPLTITDAVWPHSKVRLDGKTVTGGGGAAVVPSTFETVTTKVRPDASVMVIGKSVKHAFETKVAVNGWPLPCTTLGLTEISPFALTTL